MYFLIDDMLITKNYILVSLSNIVIFMNVVITNNYTIMNDPKKYSFDTRFVICSADFG